MLDVCVHELGRGELDVAALARLQRVVSRSAFVAIDTEMGGVSCHDTPRPSVMDSIDERYAQYCKSARKFPLVQFGLSIFNWDVEARVFRVETYQFPLFPVFHEKVTGLGHSSAPASKTTATACPDRRFLMQAKCLQYIRAHGFDLNAWIDTGIGHLSHYEQQQEPCKSALEKSARPEILRKCDPSNQRLSRTRRSRFWTN
ncbi:CAF1 family ribonuclease [Phytophthora infestans]|uniref:CAF1 family ribonuclease n=1 Tax=Phytophthora infestans TaxID=4787 RepID=A0A833SLH9_PHYIN|nr:CAF1 family ribonuclease [Phytophthora infestans]